MGRLGFHGKYTWAVFAIEQLNSTVASPIRDGLYWRIPGTHLKSLIILFSPPAIFQKYVLRRSPGHGAPRVVDDCVGPDNPVRFIDAFVDGLDLVAASFSRVEPK
jgi:hypothetical protein